MTDNAREIDPRPTPSFYSHLSDIEKGRKAVSAARAVRFAKTLVYIEAQFVRRSMSGVPKESRAEVIKELDETNAWGLSRFSDPEYLERRLAIEQRIRNEFIVKGGRPLLQHPIATSDCNIRSIFSLVETLNSKNTEKIRAT